MSAGSAFPRSGGHLATGEKSKLILRRASMYTILLVLLILMLLGALPTWPYSRAWGYYPSGGLGLVVVVVLVLLLSGRL
jgi:hypothetical protein